MTADDYARPELLVDTGWLEEHLDDPNIRIVDCDDFDQFRRAHIRNSIGVRVHHYFKNPEWQADPAGNPEVMGPDQFAELMAGMGIGDDTLVVAYDSVGSLNAARLWWVLNYYGHTGVKVLNGGWRKWFDEDRPASIATSRPEAATFTPGLEPGLLCTLEQGLAALGADDSIIIDVRTDAEWEGANDRGNKRAGHVPGAVHLEWLNFVTADSHRTFKPAGELRSLLEENGITPEKQVVTY